MSLKIDIIVRTLLIPRDQNFCFARWTAYKFKLESLHGP